MHMTEQDVTETSGDTPKVQTLAQHRNGESGYSSAKQSSRYITHDLFDVLLTGNISCALQDTWDMK